MGAAELAARYGALSADHLEYLSERGARALAAAGTVAVLLPGAYFTLRQTTPPPVPVLRAAGVPLAVSTDANPGTSPCTSILLVAQHGVHVVRPHAGGGARRRDAACRAGARSAG